MTVTFLKPDTQLKPGEQAQLGMQPYPGPLKYPFMHSYLTAFAGMMGCGWSPQPSSGSPGVSSGCTKRRMQQSLVLLSSTSILLGDTV